LNLIVNYLKLPLVTGIISAIFHFRIASLIQGIGYNEAVASADNSELLLFTFIISSALKNQEKAIKLMHYR